jgi:hypothetical protein
MIQLKKISAHSVRSQEIEHSYILIVYKEFFKLSLFWHALKRNIGINFHVCLM